MRAPSTSPTHPFPTPTIVPPRPRPLRSKLRVLLLASLTHTAHAQSPNQPPASTGATTGATPNIQLQTQSPTTHRAITDILYRADTPRADRDAAVRWLLGRSSSSAAFDSITRALGPTAPPQTRLAVLRVIAEQDSVPVALTTPLIDYLRTLPPDKRPPALLALGSVPSRHAIDTLIEHTPADVSPDARDAAFTSLTRLTGQSLARTHAAWSEWARSLPAPDSLALDRILADGRSAMRERLRDSARAEGRKQRTLYERLLTRTPPQEQPPILAEMIRSDLPDVFALGFERARIAIPISNADFAEVFAAVGEVLASEAPAHRLEAARFIRFLTPEPMRDLTKRALIAERRPEIASELLLASARWATPELMPTALYWIAAGGSPRAPACELAGALARQGELTPEERSVIRAELLKAPFNDLTSPELALLAAVGGDVAHDRFVEALAAPDVARRVVVARAFAMSPKSVDPLLTAAGADESIRSAAIQAVSRHRANVEGVRALLALRPPPPDRDPALEDAVGRILQTLPPQDVLKEALVQDARDDRIFVLQSLLTRAEEDRAAPGWRAGILSLASLYLAADEPEEAARTLAILPMPRQATPNDQPTPNPADPNPTDTNPTDSNPTAPDASAPRATTPGRLDVVPGERRIRLETALRVNELDQALALDEPLDEWLAVYDAHPNLAHRGEIARAILDTFQQELDDDRRAALENDATP